MRLARTRLPSSYVGLLYCGVAMGCAALLGLDEPLPGARATEGSDAGTSEDSGLQAGIVDAKAMDVDNATDATSIDSCKGWSFCDTFSGGLKTGWMPAPNAVYTQTAGNPPGSLSLTSPTTALLVFGAGASIKVEFDVFFDPAAEGPFFEFSALTGCDVVLLNTAAGTIALKGLGTRPIPLSAHSWHHVNLDFDGMLDAGAATLNVSFNSISVTTGRTCGSLLTERSVRFVARAGGPVWIDNVRIQD